MSVNCGLEKFRLPNDGRKWRRLCEQRRNLALRLSANTKAKIVVVDVCSLRAGLTRRTFFRRMADLRSLGLLRSIGRIGYEFDLSGLNKSQVPDSESGTNKANLALTE